MRSPMMDELAGLDPARHVRAPGGPHDPELRAVLAADRTARARYAPPRRPVRPVVVAGAAAFGVAAVAVGVTLSSTLGATPAYATWTPVPVTVDAAEAAEQAGSCPVAAHAITDGDDPQVTEVPLTPVLAETRGDYTYVVLAGDDAYGDCFVTAVPDGGEDVFTSDAAEAPLAEPDARGLVVAQGGTASWSGGEAGEGAVTSVFGRAGAEVESVTVASADGELVEATVSDGWFAAWAPGQDAFAATAQVTYTDGSTADVPLG
ncbi:hypothetical protein [Isoptericola aurantiacus]|uniref:hypothetical protein n=1 Tax=Isoptericola aurantiacus TaxID=3377839 RepID=UPI00383BAA72